MKLEGNRIVALDFGGYSFLPPPFFAFVLRRAGSSSFVWRLTEILNYPPSTEVRAMVSASCALAPFNTNNIGEQTLLFSFLVLASLPLTRIPRSMCCPGLPKELLSRSHQ